MRSFRAIFVLEMRRLARSKTLAALFAAVGAWMVALPHMTVSDGTAEGARRLYAEYSLGGVFALLVVSLAATAAGGISSARESGVLQLETVRPVRLFKSALARMAAISVAGAAALAFASAILLAKSDASRPCSRSARPVMESPREEALRMYDVFMNAPDTPEKAKKADKASVVRLLEQRSHDRYETVAPGGSVKWSFPPVPAGVAKMSARLKFSTAFSGRHEMKGRLAFGGRETELDGFTETPLVCVLAADSKESSSPVLEFKNLGKENLLFRPRADVEMLYSMKSDVFSVNLAMAWLELSALVSLVVAFCVFLGACFGRSVAVFSAMAVLLAAVAAPSAVDEGADSLEGGRISAISSATVRVVAAATRPFDALRPIGRLSDDDRIPASEALGAVACHSFLAPFVFSLLAAAAMRMKQN